MLNYHCALLKFEIQIVKVFVLHVADSLVAFKKKFLQYLIFTVVNDKSLSFLNILNMVYIVAYKDGKFKCIRFFVHAYLFECISNI